MNPIPTQPGTGQNQAVAPMTPTIPAPGPPLLPSVPRRSGRRVALIIIIVIITVVIAAFASVITLFALGGHALKTDQQNEMYEIVHSKEADKAFREAFKNLDTFAFTDK